MGGKFIFMPPCLFHMDNHRGICENDFTAHG
jgi:hypothetical protein